MPHQTVTHQTVTQNQTAGLNTPRRRGTASLVTAGIALSVVAMFLWQTGSPTHAQRWRRHAFDPSAPPRRNGVPDWEVDPRFKQDVFTFVRLRYNSYRGYGKWATDYPDSDLNFSFRLQQLTSLKVDPNGKVIEITDPALFDYPWTYMIEPGNLQFTEEEIAALRRYLFNGGFIMVDDFWGEAEWWNFYREIKRVFPDREPQELPLDHPIFHCVYDLPEKPQIPAIGQALAGRYRSSLQRHLR